MVHKQFNEVKEMLPGDEQPVKFNTPIHVKKTPHNHLITIHAAVKTNLSGVHVFDGKNWHELSPEQANAEYVIASLRQRLKLNERN